MEIGLRWFPVLLGYNPRGGLVRISGGLMFNGSSADASYVPEFTVELGGHTYIPEDVGEVQMQPVSPYLGEDLAMEADSFQDALDDFQIYPVLSAGLMYSW